ncbi:hypothetical protein [Marinobacter segnicrescens]|uniref:hypothetical protein n=1 Tax=Marinobacter segnicrescens TaxID=430453 RepID=UPI003A8EDCFF
MTGYQETSDKAWQFAHYRKLRARSRLSFMLLDIFLGGFVVGIVLMITLGRPTETNVARGAGGESFMAIDVYWEDPEVILAPVVQFKVGTDFRSLNQYGLSSIWGESSGSSNIWPAYNVATGEISLKTSYSARVQLDGFDPRHSGVPMTRERLVGEQVLKLNFGQIWISEPCAGDWRVGIRVIETPVAMDPNTPLRIWIDVTTGGFSNSAANGTVEEIASWAVRQSGEIFSPMTVTGNTSYLAISLPGDKDDPAARCVP